MEDEKTNKDNLIVVKRKESSLEYRTPRLENIEGANDKGKQPGYKSDANEDKSLNEPQEDSIGNEIFYKESEAETVSRHDEPEKKFSSWNFTTQPTHDFRGFSHTIYNHYVIPPPPDRPKPQMLVITCVYSSRADWVKDRSVMDRIKGEEAEKRQNLESNKTASPTDTIKPEDLPAIFCEREVVPNEEASNIGGFDAGYEGMDILGENSEAIPDI